MENVCPAREPLLLSWQGKRGEWGTLEKQLFRSLKPKLNVPLQGKKRSTRKRCMKRTDLWQILHC